MVFDIGWISELLYGTKSGSAASAAQLAKAGRASRLGTRAGRIVRVVRLIRLTKLYKHAQQAMEQQQLQQQHQEEEEEMMNLVEINKQKSLKTKLSNELNKTPYANQQVQSQASINPTDTRRSNGGGETKVGQKLSDLTNRRVITIVLSILFSVPLFSLDTYREENTSFDSGLRGVLYWKQRDEMFRALLSDYVAFHRDQRQKLVFLEVGGEKVFEDEKKQRNEDLVYYSVAEGSSDAVVVVSLAEDARLSAILSLARTVFISVVLGVGSVVFSKGVQDLVLTPIECMIARVDKIAENPLEAAQEEEEAEVGEGDETAVLQRLIAKIGALLAVGFGEAGAQVIAENMRQGGEVDPMVSGKKVTAVFGFCDIRHFAEATDVLQEDIIMLVNEIAEIVHGTVSQFGGNVNKNIGDAFLLVWKIGPQTADLAVLSFVKILIAVELSSKLVKYSIDERMRARVPDFKARMGFGLHCGWAIEGTIGSQFKVDASYLSPNVNLASRLEAATKQFGTSILISGSLQQLCSPETQGHLRQIDRVTVKGSIEPMDFFCVDIDFQGLKEFPKQNFFIQAKTGQEIKLQKRKQRMRRERMRSLILKGKLQMSSLWKKDKQILAARAIFTKVVQMCLIRLKAFRELWEEGFSYYLAGRWEDAKEVFSKTLCMLPNYIDGPSNTLLKVIEEELPNNWKGYRPLLEK